MRAFEQAWAFLKAEDPFRMKRPEMVLESTGIMDELARREWNRGDKGKDEFGAFTGAAMDEEEGSALDEYGGIDFRSDDLDTENISDETFRSKRPEMESRLTELNEELQRRGRPLIGEKVRDRFEDYGTADDGSTMWAEHDVGHGQISENLDLLDAIADKVRDSHLDAASYKELLERMRIAAESSDHSKRVEDY